MGKQTHHTVLHRLFCLLIAVHLINMSVDAPDGYAIRVLLGEQHENLSVNDIESLSELVLEECFGLVNAVPEHEEPDQNSSLTELEEEYIFAQWFVFAPFPPSILRLTANTTPFEPHNVPTPVAEIVAPPPRFTA